MDDWDDSVEDARRLARRHLDLWGCTDGPTRLVDIARGLDVSIIARPCWVSPDFTGVAVQIDGFRLIVVNSLLMPARRAFTIAHELGHIALDHRPPRNGNHERDANAYASELLMPTGRVLAQIQIDGPDVARLAYRCGVSYTAMARRLSELTRRGLVQVDGGW